MNINKYLQSRGVVFPKDCSFENLQYLDSLGAILIFEYYNEEDDKWKIDYIYTDAFRYSRYKTRPLEIKHKKILLLAVEIVLIREISQELLSILNMAIWLVHRI